MTAPIQPVDDPRVLAPADAVDPAGEARYVAQAVLVHRLHWFRGGEYVNFVDNPLGWANKLFLAWVTLAFVYAATYTRLTRAASAASSAARSSPRACSACRASGGSASTLSARRTCRSSLA